MSNVFGVNDDAMSAHWIELGYLKRHGDKMMFQLKAHDKMMSKVLDQIKTEASSSATNGLGTKRFMKMGSTSKRPKIIWIEYTKHPRRVRPPEKLESKEIADVAAESTMHIIKNSTEFSSIVKLCLR